jgi:uncharacterized protein with von Willebrand factor type A (vWA) domain
MREKLTSEEIDKAKEVIDGLCDQLNDLLDGHNKGHIIPALICTLAVMHSEEVMSRGTFVAAVMESLNKWLDDLEIAEAEEEKGNAQWLQ